MGRIEALTMYQMAKRIFDREDDIYDKRERSNLMAVFKKEFIDRMAETGGITKKAARQGFDLFIETLLDCMSENEKVMFTGLGRFEMKTVKERKARMPLGGDDIIIPEHRKMKFYPSRLLSGTIKNMREEE